MIALGENRLLVRKPLTRRALLRAGGVGLGALGLTPFSQLSQAATANAVERSVILLMMVGGPSHLETWDPKPDAPTDVRGPFRSIATRCAGVRICEHFSLIATRTDRIALVRSVHHDAAPIHETGQQLLQTGRLCRGGEDHPHFGAIVGHLRRSEAHSNSFALIPGPIANTGVDIPHGQTAGWLGGSFRPFDHTSNTVLQSAFNLDQERPQTRERYGRTAFGQNCLIARRLVEAGTHVVNVNMYDTVFNRVSWDCHGSSPFSTLDDYAREVLPTFDRAFTALIDDLEQRGRLESTLVVAAGEFGRTPRINAAGGRDHWPGVWSVALAGGGVRGGQVVGASDPRAGFPLDRPVTPQDLLATIYLSLGIDSRQYLVGPAEESAPLVEDGSPIRELFV